jgi:hypothetical protein
VNRASAAATVAAVVVAEAELAAAVTAGR